MYPMLDLLNFHLDLYLVMIGVAVVVSNRLGLWIAENVENIPRARMHLMLISLMVAAFAGARAQYVWNTWGSGHYIREPLSMLKVWAGLHAGGGLFALLIAFPMVARWQGVSLGRFADAIVPTVAVGLAIVRIGCFLHGCCFGDVSTLPWAVTFPQGSPAANFHLSSATVPPGAPSSAPVHPLQLYLAASGLLAAIAASWTYRRRAYPGQVALVTAAVLCTLNAFFEGLRAPYYPSLYFWGARMQFEWIAIALAVVSIGALGAGEIRRSIIASGLQASAVKRMHL